MPSEDRSRTQDGGRPVRPVTVAALAVVVVVAALMAVDGRAIDPWTGLLATAMTAGAMTTLAPQRRAPGPAPTLHDDADVETGVGNVRAALALIDREVGRADNYGSVFALAVLELDHSLFTSTPPRRARRVQRALFRGVADDVRASDRVCRVTAADRDLMVVLLPDTGPRGAHIFADRLRSHARDHLVAEGVAIDDALVMQTFAHPADAPAIEELRRRLQVLEGADALIRDIAVQPVRMPRRPTDARPLRLPEATSTGSTGR